MKIILATLAIPPYTSGVATFTLNLAQQLSSKHQVIIISSTSGKKPVVKTINPRLKFYLFPGINITKPTKLTIAWPHNQKVEVLIKRFRPNIIHLQDFSPICLSVLLSANNLKIPTLITHHFTAEHIFQILIPAKKISNLLSYNSEACKLIYRLLRPIYNRCQLITVPNPKLIPLLQKAKFKPPLISIPNGIFTRNFTQKRPLKEILSKYNIQQTKIILFVGRLALDKNLHLLIEAFKTVHQFNPDTALVFVGDGNQKHQLENLAFKLEIKPAVYFLGRIDNQSAALSHLYNASFIYANPSIIENQSVAFIEAMVAGLPIVAANQLIQTSIIQPGKNGLLVEPNSSSSLAVALQKLLSEPKLYRSISRFNRRLGSSFDIRLVAQQFLHIYQSLL